MGKAASASAILLTKRTEIRDAIRQALKAEGLKSESIANTTEEKECLLKISRSDYALLILDWELGAEKIQNVLTQSRRNSQLESHPVFLLAAHEDQNIVAMAREFFISHVAVGEISNEKIQGEIKALVREYLNISPIRKMLLAADAHRRKNENQQALDILEKILEKQPENQRVALEVAEVNIHDGNWAAASQMLGKFVKRDDALPRIKHLFARCRLREGDHSGAIAALKDAQLMSPYNVERLLEMGELFLKTDQPSQAEEAFNKVLDFASGSKEAKLGKSTSKLLQGEINEALQVLQGIASPRELSAVFNTAAILAIRSQDFETGMGLYQKAAQILSGNAKLAARIYFNMGIGFVKSGKTDKGLKCFQKSVENDPSFEAAAHNLKILESGHSIKPRSESAPAKADPARDFLADFDEKISAQLPLTDLGGGAGEEVELDDLFQDIEKVS